MLESLTAAGARVLGESVKAALEWITAQNTAVFGAEVEGLNAMLKMVARTGSGDDAGGPEDKSAALFEENPPSFTFQGAFLDKDGHCGFGGLLEGSITAGFLVSAEAKGSTFVGYVVPESKMRKNAFGGKVSPDPDYVLSVGRNAVASFLNEERKGVAPTKRPWSEPLGSLPPPAKMPVRPLAPVQTVFPDLTLSPRTPPFVLPTIQPPSGQPVSLADHMSILGPDVISFSSSSGPSLLEFPLDGGLSGVRKPSIMGPPLVSHFKI